jgi:histidinol-phosphate aminotransferase
LERRRLVNETRRHHLVGALAERELSMAESHTNFIYFELGEPADSVIENMNTRGVLIRGMGGGWVRVTIGNEDENRRFLEALDAALT